MKVFNKAKTDSTKTYLYNIYTDRFGARSTPTSSHQPDVMVIVDDHLYAQEIDLVFTEVFAELGIDQLYA